MKRVIDDTNTMECCYYYMSSAARNPREAITTLTLETGGDCLGPADFHDEIAEEALAYLSEHWEEAEEMSPEDAWRRILHLCEEWELTVKDLSYLM